MTSGWGGSVVMAAIAQLFRGHCGHVRTRPPTACNQALTYILI